MTSFPEPSPLTFDRRPEDEVPGVHEIVKKMQEGATLPTDFCIRWGVGETMIEKLISGNLKQANELIQAVKRRQPCVSTDVEKLANALDLLRAAIELQQKQFSGRPYVLGSFHQYPDTPSNEFYAGELGVPYEPTRMPEPEPLSATEAWPQHWPSYYHSSEPCDMKVGPCCCGAWHIEGEFTLEKTGLNQFYIQRHPLNWPSDHVGGNTYSSQCDCMTCKGIRAAASRRDW